GLLGREDQVALVLAVLVVDHDHGLARRDISQGPLHRGEPTIPGAAHSDPAFLDVTRTLGLLRRLLPRLWPTSLFGRNGRSGRGPGVPGSDQDRIRSGSEWISVGVRSAGPRDGGLTHGPGGAPLELGALHLGLGSRRGGGGGRAVVGVDRDAGPVVPGPRAEPG